MANQFYVYILFSIKFHRYYVGQTADINSRYSRHNKGYVKSTKNYLPWELVWYIQVESRSESMRLEAKIKSWKSVTMIKRLIEKEINLIG